jgi:hypothetical protein
MSNVWHAVMVAAFFPFVISNQSTLKVVFCEPNLPPFVTTVNSQLAGYDIGKSLCHLENNLFDLDPNK